MVSPLQLAPTSAKSWIRHWKQNDGVCIFPLTYHRYITTKRREFREWSTLISNTESHRGIGFSDHENLCGDWTKVHWTSSPSFYPLSRSTFVNAQCERCLKIRSHLRLVGLLQLLLCGQLRAVCIKELDQSKNGICTCNCDSYSLSTK